MDDLPPPLILEILSRLNDSFDLARCKIASKTLNDLSREVRSVNLQCSFDRYTKSRFLAPTKAKITPFKTIFRNLVSSSGNVDSVSLGVGKPLRDMVYDDVEDEDDDLYLTDEKFVSEWLPGVCGRLRSISITDFWIQSCWRRSEILSVISSFCDNLVELELKNAWLSVDGLSQMPALKTLTLEFVRLDDEDLNNVNRCFPSLQVLNLNGVGGLKEPKIHLLHLKTCQWTVSNAPLSLTIVAPCLIEFKLKCVRPKSIVINAPLLANFHLSLDKASNFEVEQFPNLKYLHLESTDLISLVGAFPSSRTVTNLTVDSPYWAKSMGISEFCVTDIFNVFPYVTCLTFGSGAWSLAGTCYSAGCLEFDRPIEGLKAIIAHIVLQNIGGTRWLIAYVLEKCFDVADMTLIFHQEVQESVACSFVSSCMADHPRVRWKWRMLKEGSKVA